MLRYIIVAVCLCSFSLQSATAQQNRNFMPISKSKAKLWSLRATLAPMIVGGACLTWAIVDGTEKTNNIANFGAVVGCAGVVFGPGAGHAYAKQSDRFWIGTIIRAAAGGVVALGVSEANFFGNTDNSGVFIIMCLGSAAALVSAIYDLATVGESVDEYNEEQRFRSLALRPTYSAKYKAPGVMFTLSF